MCIVLTSVHNYVIVPGGTERAVNRRQLNELGTRSDHAQYPHAGPPRLQPPSIYY